LINELKDLLCCDPNKCNGCSVQRQDEGDKKPWCGFSAVLRKTITYIEVNEDRMNL
jgi:hypothetical protein